MISLRTTKSAPTDRPTSVCRPRGGTEGKARMPIRYNYIIIMLQTTKAVLSCVHYSPCWRRVHGSRMNGAE